MVVLERTRRPARPARRPSVSHAFPRRLSPVVTMLSSGHAPDVVRKRAQCSLSLMTFSPGHVLPGVRRGVTRRQRGLRADGIPIVGDDQLRVAHDRGELRQLFDPRLPRRARPGCPSATAAARY